MAIRGKNLALGTDLIKDCDGVNLGVIAAGSPIHAVFVSPYACTVDYIDVYPVNGLIAGASDTLNMRPHIGIVSGTADKPLLTGFSIATSAASNIYAKGTRIRLTPTANNSLTVGTIISIQFSAVCQGAPSQTYVLTTYTRLIHKESR